MDPAMRTTQAKQHDQLMQQQVVQAFHHVAQKIRMLPLDQGVMLLQSFHSTLHTQNLALTRFVPTAHKQKD